MNQPTPQIPNWQKSIVQLIGLLLLLVGLAPLCAYAAAFAGGFLGGESVIPLGVGALALALLTFAAGAIMYRESTASLAGRASEPMRLPSALALAGVFGLCVFGGLVITAARIAPGALFPPLLIAAAATPPLFAVSWFARGQSADLTRRRGRLAFVFGATFSVIIAVLLELVLPAFLLSAVFNSVTRAIQSWLDALAGADVAKAFANPGFILAFAQIAVIAPLVEEFAKPLVLIPMLRNLTRREAFLVGALAGAGFAALENVVYTGFGSSFWAGVLLVRALGCAIHPLGAGLVSVAWRDVLNGEAHARRNVLARFGVAGGMHALWNGGSLIVITLGGVQFFGRRAPNLDVLGLSVAGTTLALLIVLGLAALWLGRAMAERAGEANLFSIGSLPHLPRGFMRRESADREFNFSDRAIAIWAVACLVVIVPLGILGLRLWLR